MSTSTCQLCGSEYSTAADLGPDDETFTTITVSYHDEDREDFAESVCQDCGDRLLADVVDELGLLGEVLEA